MARAVPVTEKVETFVKDQIAEARERLTVVESEAANVATRAEKAAQKAVKQVTSRAGKVANQAEKAADKAVKDIRATAKKGQKEAKAIFKGRNKLVNATAVKGFFVKAQGAGGELLKGIQSLQDRALKASGVASQNDLKTLARDVSRLNKKVEALLKQNGNG